MVAGSVASSGAVASLCPSRSATKFREDEFMKEIETNTEQLTKTRNTLWESQDMLRVSEKKAQQLEMHVAELVAARNQDAVTVKQTREQNARCLEEEAKMKESLDLMKKVFTRNQLKSKEDQETISLLQEERDLLLQENEKLRSITMKQSEQNSIKDESKDESNTDIKKDSNNESWIKKDTKNESNNDSKDKSTSADSNAKPLSEVSRKNERLLSDALERTRKELREYRKMQAHSDNKIRKLKNKLMEARSSKRQEEPGLMDRLERNVKSYVQGTEGRDDGTDIVARAFFDEDLEESRIRDFLQNLNCSSPREVCSAGREFGIDDSAYYE
jgi:hypothetical protein